MSSKAALAKSLGVSRQSLYYRPIRPQKDEILRDEILTIMKANPSYGHKRLATHFKRRLKRKVNKKRILRIMQKYHIKPAIERGKKWHGKGQEYVSETIPNRIRHICASQPDVIWVGDFTELVFHARKIYFATVLDDFTRELVAWQIGMHHTTRLVLDVLEEAKRKRKATPQYFHSDQGSEYTSHECIQSLVRNQITPSMSPKGKPWNNGKQESFYRTFKTECGTPQKLPNIEALIEVIGKFINYYNNERIHSELDMAPREFYEEKKWPRRPDIPGA
jgi:putative transposase